VASQTWDYCKISFGFIYRRSPLWEDFECNHLLDSSISLSCLHPGSLRSCTRVSLDFDLTRHTVHHLSGPSVFARVLWYDDDHHHRCHRLSIKYHTFIYPPSFSYLLILFNIFVFVLHIRRSFNGLPGPLSQGGHADPFGGITDLLFHNHSYPSNCARSKGPQLIYWAIRRFTLVRLIQSLARLSLSNKHMITGRNYQGTTRVSLLCVLIFLHFSWSSFHKISHIQYPHATILLTRIICVTYTAYFFFVIFRICYANIPQTRRAAAAVCIHCGTDRSARSGTPNSRIVEKLTFTRSAPSTGTKISRRLMLRFPLKFFAPPLFSKLFFQTSRNRHEWCK
jgi:hypothetical protein